MSKLINIGILTPTEEGGYYGALIHGISLAAKKIGARVFVIQTFSNMTVTTLSKYDYKIAWKQIDGWVILPHAVNQEYLKNLCALEKPVVLISEDMDNPLTKTISPDNFGGMKAAVNHLISHGHKRIAFLGCFQLGDMKPRYEGYVEALQENGLDLDLSIVFDAVDAMQEGGAKAAVKMIDMGVPFTAVACGCDYSAIGLIRVFKDQGYILPQQMAIVGFDDMEMGRTMFPALTTVRVELSKLSQRAIESISLQLQGLEQTQHEIFVNSELMIRCSCGCEDDEKNLIAELKNSNEKYLKTINSLMGILFNSFEIGHQLMSGNIGITKSLKWLPPDIKWGCLAMFDKEMGSHNLIINEYIDLVNDKRYPVDIKCTTDEFPPLSILPSVENAGENDLVWVHPVSNDSSEWGVMVVIGPMKEGRLLFSADSWQKTMDLLAFSFERQSLEEEIKVRGSRFRRLLNNVNQGFLMVDKNLIIDHEYSPACKKIFEMEIDKKNISQLLFPDDLEKQEDMKNIIGDILNKTDYQKENLFLSLLPDEVVIGKRNIQIEYKVVSDSGVTNRIMLIVTDSTEHKKLEAEVRFEKSALNMVVKVMTNYYDFNISLKEYKHFCQKSMLEILESRKTLDDIYLEIFRGMHTFKGTFSMMDMSHVVEKIHLFEEELSLLRVQFASMSRESFREFILGKDMAKWVEDDILLLKKVMGEEYFNLDDIIILSESKIKEIEQSMIATLSPFECNNFLSMLRKLRYRSIKDLLKTYPEYMEKLSHRMEKLVYTFEIEGEDLQVDMEKYFGFTKSLVNVFRNALDHGIEMPDERVTKGKDEYGSIKCSILLQGEYLKIIISDDGKGIDVSSIKRVSIAKGLFKDQEFDALSKDEQLEMIFRDDFSTEELVTEISGRGEGLAAVKFELEKLDGKMEIHSQVDVGTSFTFRFPFEKEVEINENIIETVKHSILTIAKDWFTNRMKFTLLKLQDFQKSETQTANLYPIASYVEFKGVLHGWIVLSAEEKLAREMVRRFVLEPLTKEEEEELMEEVMAECTNTVLGNSINYYEDIEDLVEMGVPIRMNIPSGGTIKYPKSDVWEGKLRGEFGELCICIVLSSTY